MLTNDFILLCKEFTGKHQVKILDERVDDSKKLCKYTIYFFDYILEFRYVKKESVYFKPSSLYCVIGLRKNSVIYYHLTDIMPHLERKSFKSCYFSNIENPKRLKVCFESLERSIELVTSQISPFLLDDFKLSEDLFKNYKMIFNLKDSNIDFAQVDNKAEYAHEYFLSLQNVRDGYVFSRFSSFAPYEAIVKKKIDRAISKYEKLGEKGKLFEYEKQLLNHIKSLENEAFTIFDDDCDTNDSVHKFTAFFAFLKAFIVVFLATSLVFCGFCAVYNLVVSSGAKISLAAPWYIGFLCAALCSIFGCIAFFRYMPSRRLTKEQRKELSNTLISKGVKRFSIIAFVASLAVALFFAIMIMKSNVRFYDDYLAFDSKTYSYNRIDSVYYINSRHNDYGDRIYRASYVILFDDKTSLDLDGYTSVEYTKDHVLPFLSKKQHIEVKEVDSEKQLPW